MTASAQSPLRVRFLHEPGMDGVFPSPIPAAKAIPPYFKALPPTTDGNPMNPTAKRCLPFVDAMAQGFVIPLWADMFVQTRDGNITVHFPQGLPMQQSLDFHRSEQLKDHPFSGLPYGKILCKLISPWLVQTDPGVSCLFTAPLNHMEARFKIIDGVVDTDTYYNNVNFPFVWTEGDGEFLIPKGTPVVQVIPFRRETPALELGTLDADRRQHVRDTLGTTFQHGYRKNYRHGADPADTDTENV